MAFFTSSSICVLSLADWLDMAAGRNSDYEVVLPMIQRGFVWKPAQIIELWDSLLQGMPIGTLMVSEMRDEGDSLPLNTDSTPKVGDAGSDRSPLALVDGQQRTLAMLMGWVPSADPSTNPRLWVDFGDEPPSGHRLRLRVTTRNQPFGFRRDDPNVKLSMNDRRCAKTAYQSVRAADYRPHPAGARHSLPLDFAALLNDFRVMDAEAWMSSVQNRLESIEVLHCRGGNATLRSVWPEIPEDVRALVDARIQRLAEGLDRVLTTEIPLVRVDPSFFSVGDVDAIEPPLARLFKRIGSNATPLSNADYVYSVLKHMMPQVHGMVESLHSAGHVASLMSSTDLVMSALRLGATAWTGENDRDNPSKEDFHRMIWPKSGTGPQRQEALRALLNREGEHTLTRYFDTVQHNLEYRGESDPGLPRHLFPYLERPLVQVLLRLAQVGYLQSPSDEESRADVLRLTLWWMQWVFDKPKASRIAFKVIQESQEHVDLGQKIAEAIMSEGAGMRVQSPESIERLALHDSSRDGEPRLFGQSRFATPADDTEEHRLAREFYRHWWRPWNYRHPMLLWLQRDYVNGLDGDPMAGMDEDTSYDFDHILPQAHWGAWTGIGGNSRLLDFLSQDDKDAHHVIGNGIGNVRVWSASDNRSDGDDSPKVKMGQQHEERAAWMKRSAINEGRQAEWEACSPQDEADKKHWTLVRALAFQRAVERRTFDVYQQFYLEGGFACWLASMDAPA